MTWTNFSRDDVSQGQQLAGLMAEADAIVVGIGAGMSASDGFTYIGSRFEDNFPDFIAKYGFLDMLQASLFHLESLEEYWAFHSRFVVLNYLDQPLGAAYVNLKTMLTQLGKPYFVITTNADNAFEVADYDTERLFHIQGKYALMQCSRHCHAQTYRDDALMRQMVAQQADMKVPRDLIPYCPVCDAPLEINKRNADSGMVEDGDFHEQEARYKAFLSQYEEGKVLYIEIGVGYTTPQYIKHPFQARTLANPEARFVSLNQKLYRFPTEVRAQSLTLTEDIAQLLAEATGELSLPVYDQ